MGGRGSKSSNASKKVERATKKAAAVTSDAAPKAASSGGGGGGKSAADKIANTSVKSLTKGLTQESVKKMSRKELEKIALVQATKLNLKDPFQKGIDAAEALRRAKILAPYQTTAQLRKLVWKYRNMD